MAKQDRPGSSPSNFVYTPSRGVKVALDEYRRRASVKISLNWGIEGMDGWVVPAIPGDLISILGRPGMAKTYLLIYLARRFENLINASPNPGEKNIIVYATWETLVEEFMGILSSPVSTYTLEDIGKGEADLNVIEESIVSVLGQKIVVFGRSKDNKESKQPPNLYQLDQALFDFQESGYTIRALLVDYLQRIPVVNVGGQNVLGSMGKTVGISENLEHLKNIAIRYGIPVWTAVQARREVDTYKNVKFPLLDDGQWTSNVEQTSDKVFSVTMPGKYTPKGEEVTVNKWDYPVNEGSIAIKMLKQRFGPCNQEHEWMVQFNFKNLSISPHYTSGEEQGF